MDKTDLRTRRICVVNEKEQTWEEPTQFNAYCPNCREVVLHQTAQYKREKDYL